MVVSSGGSPSDGVSYSIRTMHVHYNDATFVAPPAFLFMKCSVWLGDRRALFLAALSRLEDGKLSRTSSFGSVVVEPVDSRPR